MPGSINVRPLQDADLEAVVALYNDGGFGPVAGGHALTVRDIQALLAEKGTYLFLIAEDQETQRIVGTLGMMQVSEQRVARPGEIYASFFFIDPEYRNGSIPNWLFITALRALMRDGYTSIGATVSPANVTALSLYKRIGLYRLQASTLDYDGQVELRGYQPLVMRAIKNLRLAEAEQVQHRESLWRFLTPTQSLRASNVDSEIWHGLEVVTYEMNAGNLHFLFRVDVASDGLVEMQTNEMHFCMYPLPGSQVLVSEEVKLICELTNTSAEVCTYSLSLDDDPLLASRAFQPQEVWRQESDLRFASKGVYILQSSLHMPQGTQDFRLGVTVNARINLERVSPQSVLRSGEPGQIPVRLLNATRQAVEGTVQGIAPTLTGFRLSPARITLAAGEATELLLSGEHIGAGLHPFSVAVESTDGGHWSTETVTQPALLTEQRVSYQEGREYVLESPDVRVTVDQETGLMRAWEKQTARLVLYEAWPDVGLPLPGGLKRGPKRVLSVLSPDQEDQAQGTLTLVESLQRGGLLQRRFRLAEDMLLEISQSWTPGEDAEHPQAMVRTYGQCAFRQDMLTVPLKQGWQTRAVIYGEYPYGLHEYEAIPSADLPRHKSGYAENWSAFEEKGLTVGLLWQDADEICFGTHWMPSLLFAAHSEGGAVRLPDYAYAIGREGAEGVARHWRNRYGGQTQQSIETCKERAVPVYWPGQAGNNLYKLSNSGQAESQDMPERAVRIIPVLQKKGYRVENGELGFQVEPGRAGSITNLTYRGTNLLQVAPPRAKPFGDNGVWYGGIHPARVDRAVGLLSGFLCEQQHLQQFQAQTVSELDEQGQCWQGVELTGDDLCVKYELVAHAPTLRLVTEYHNTRSVTQTFHLLFHFFFRSTQSRVPRAMYYERQGSRAFLREEAKTRRVYTDDWSILSLGKEMAVALCAEPGSDVEIATYEWPRDGFQHLLIQRFCVPPGGKQRMQARLLVRNSLEQLLAAADLTSGENEQRRLPLRVSA